MANTKKAHNRKINAVMNLGIDNFNLLDKKLDQHGEVIIIKTDEVMKHAEENINEVVLTEEEFEKLVDEMADQLFEKSMDLPYEKKTKKTNATKDADNLSDDELLPNQDPAEPEGDARFEETREEDSETQSMKAEGSQVGRKQDIIEIEESINQ